MGKAIIRAPHIDAVILDNVLSFNATEVGIVFYSDESQSGYAVGIAPLSAIVELIE